jgi:hypothetical protein
MKFRHFLPIALLCGVFAAGVAHVRAQMWSPWVKGTPVAAGGYTGTCPASTAFVNRARAAYAGPLPTTPAYEASYDTMICGLVTDGVWALLDALWVPAAVNAAVGNLNLMSSSFTLTNHGATFAANSGYTGVDQSTTVWVDTGYTPSTSKINYAQNSAHAMGWSFTNATSTSYPSLLATYDGTNMTAIFPRANANVTFAGVNVPGSTIPNVPGSSSLGSYVAVRSGATSSLLYVSGANVPLTTQASVASTPLPTYSIYLVAENSSGTPAAGGPYQLPAASVGGALTAAQVSSLLATPVTSANAGAATGLIPRICTYLFAVHGALTC